MFEEVVLYPYYLRPRPYRPPLLIQRTPLMLLHQILKNGKQNEVGQFECLLSTSATPNGHFFTHAELSRLLKFMEKKNICYRLITHNVNGQPERLLAFEKLHSYKVMSQNDVIAMLDIAYPQENFLQYLLLRSPLDKTLQAEIAPLMRTIMQHGETMEATGYFRCIYQWKTSTKDLLTDEQANKIIDTLIDQGIFCGNSLVHAKENPYTDKGVHQYLLFNKTKSQLHHLFSDICPGYENEPAQKSKLCIIL